MTLYNNTHSVLPHSNARYDPPCVVSIDVGEVSVLCNRICGRRWGGGVLLCTFLIGTFRTRQIPHRTNFLQFQYLFSRHVPWRVRRNKSMALITLITFLIIAFIAHESLEAIMLILSCISIFVFPKDIPYHICK